MSNLSAEQLQYACDLINANNERTDDAQMKCKVGKPCNGRCIPQNHQCIANGSEASGQKKPWSLKKKVAVGIGAYLGANALASVAVAHHFNSKN